MALPPLPLQDLASLPFSLQEWLRNLQRLVGGAVGSIPWTSINTAGSALTDIATRLHNSLQSIQGGTTGSYFHLKTAVKGSKTHDFGTVNAVTNATTTQTVTGATTTSTVIVTATTTLVAGLVVYGYVSSADTVTLVCTNPTAGNIAATSKTYQILVLDN